MKQKNYQENSYRKTNSIAGGILLILISVLCLISLFGGMGNVGNMIKAFLLGFTGLASYGYAFMTLLLGVLLIFQKRPTISIKNEILLSLMFVFFLIIFQATTSNSLINNNYGTYLTKCYYDVYTAGGLLYGLITYPLLKAMGELATIIVFSLLMVVMFLILAAPIVNKEFTFSYSRKDRPTSYNAQASSRKYNEKRVKEKKVEVPREPSFSILGEDEDNESERISDDSDIIAYSKQDDNDLIDFEGGKGRKNRKQNKEEMYTDVNNVDATSSINDEQSGLYRKEALRNDESELKNYNGSILNGIREVKEQEDKDKLSRVDLKNMSAADIIRYNNTEEGRKRIIDQQLEQMVEQEKAMKAQQREEERIEEEKLKQAEQEKEEEKVVDIKQDASIPMNQTCEDDNCYYIDQFGVRRRYYGIDLNETIKENDRQLLHIDKNDNPSRLKKDDPEYLRSQGVYDYKRDFDDMGVFNPHDESSLRDAFSNNNDEEEFTRSDEPRVELNTEIKDTVYQDDDTYEPYVEEKEEEIVEPIKEEVEEVEEIEEVEEVEEEEIKEEKPKKISDFSYDAVNEEAKDKLYSEHGIEKPTGEKLEKFVQDDIDNSPSTIDVDAAERKHRSDLGGTHNKKFMDEKSIQFLKDALGKNEEKPQTVYTEPETKEEKYPYIPAFIQKGKYKYHPPKIDLLKQFDTTYQKDADWQERGQIIEDTLRSMGVETKVVNYTQGAAFSRYELEVDASTNLSKLVSCKENLSLALATRYPVDIEAPIRGKSLVGVEVPNRKVSAVGLREAISSPEFRNPDAYLSIVLGKDISGKVNIGDIRKMTHMLIAGATGSGKSVCLNAILSSILFKYSPEDVRFILVDPKMVELSVYNGLPHMLVPNSIIEPDQVIAALKWLDREMERRLELFKTVQSRELQGYNEKVSPEEKLPVIVLVIDEFADIMMQSQKIGSEMEELISRIARMSRAVGIHMILATQRPSAEYITGPIKANIPTRIAFKTDSSLNSRIILDENGAEKLMGNGDMLYKSREPGITRMQCPFLSDDEVSSITDYIRDNNKVEYDDRIIEDIMKCKIDKPEPKPDIVPTKIENKAKLDEMFLPVLKFLIEDNYNSPPSITKVQREFEMGFPRAAGLIDKIAKFGFIVKDGRKYVLNVTMQEFENIEKELNQDE